ncbi:MAG: dipeptidase PepE [Gilvibacter sp.]
MQNIIIASTSTVHGSGYLAYLKERLTSFFSEADTILFIPFARPGGITHDAYTQIAAQFFKQIGKQVVGLHEASDTKKAIREAQAIFTGGGNTFVLVNALYQTKSMATLREVILNGTPYLGTSAGSNICGLTMQTTNDMPITYPPSFKTLGVIPFNINPHYLDPDPGSTHMGETRETRIKEYHAHNTVPVIGLREGSWLEVIGESITLHGDQSARLFLSTKEPKEVDANFNFADLAKTF